MLQNQRILQGWSSFYALPRQKEHDIDSCEFSKNGDVKRKVITDNAKVVTEVKYISGYIARVCRLEQKENKKINHG